MEMNVSTEAANWYKTEFDLAQGAFLRFFVRYGGEGLIPGFSLGVKEATPDNALVRTEAATIHFFIEESDAWYFEEKQVHVSLASEAEGPIIEYV